MERECARIGECHGTRRPLGRERVDPPDSRIGGLQRATGRLCAGPIRPAVFRQWIVVGNGARADISNSDTGQRESDSCGKGTGHQHSNLAKQASRISRVQLSSLRVTQRFTCGMGRKRSAFAADRQKRVKRDDHRPCRPGGFPAVVHGIAIAQSVAILWAYTITGETHHDDL